jgi:hypothetical protein
MSQAKQIRDLYFLRFFILKALNYREILDLIDQKTL